MSIVTTTADATDNVNNISESEPIGTSTVDLGLIITNKVNRVLDYTTSNGKKFYKDELDNSDNKVYGKAFTVVTADLSYEHPKTISMKALSAIKASKVQQEKPFLCADGSDGEDTALCYVLTGDVRTFPESTDIDKLTGEPMVTPERKCGNYYPFFGYTPVPPTNVDLTQ